MKDSVINAVEAALQEFRKERNLTAALEVIAAATRAGTLELGDYDQACDEFRQKAALDDGEQSVEDWDSVKSKSLLEQAGLLEVTETDIEPARSGAEVELAGATAD